MKVFTGYFKRNIQIEIKNGKEVVMKNGIKAIKDTYPACGTKVFRIFGKK